MNYVAVCFMYFVLALGCSPTVEIEYEPQNWGVEGVLVSVEQENGMDVLVFEDERVFVHLGSHEVYPGEWNAVILNPRGYVEEVWLGEDWREQHE